MAGPAGCASDWKWGIITGRSSRAVRLAQLSAVVIRSMQHLQAGWDAGGTKEDSGVAFAAFPRPPIADDAQPDYQRANDGAKPLPNRWHADFHRCGAHPFQNRKMLRPLTGL
jgi:hypothetical protein